MPNAKPKTKVIKAQKSSGNVFADLGLSDPGGRLVKAQLAGRICKVITGRQLTQTKAAELMELDQPKVSDLTRGKLDGFSIDRLFRCLNQLGQEVRITIQPVSGGQLAGTCVVLAEAA